MTVEHLLLALIDVNEVVEVLRACGADIDKLRRDLAEFVDETTPRVAEDQEQEVQPTLGFQRVLQRAVFHIQSSGKDKVNATNVLVAIFGEKQSHAAYLLSMQDVVRLDVVNYISHGLSKISDANPQPGDAAEAAGEGKEVDVEAGPLEQFATNLNEEAAQGRIDPLIGRELEIERTIEILCRRRKQNRAGRGPRAQDPRGQRAGRVARLHDLLAGHGHADRRHQVSRRL
jgi:ATP-dependent Clp protease ATP-binding subunit ClpA